MLSDAPLSAVVPSTDIERSKDFYQNKLGLKQSSMQNEQNDQYLFFEAGKGTTLLVYYRQEGNKAEHTQVGFGVVDVEQTVKDLEAKGVVFEDYDTPNLKTVNHIATYDQSKAAWFKDPDGNIIAINQM